MIYQSESVLDAIDYQIVDELQADARLSFSELGRRVNLSQPTIAERVRRLEERGVIRGYHIDLDPSQIGRPITAFIRLRISHPNARQYKFEKLIETEPEFACITECHRITGDDCLLLKVYVSSIQALNEFLGKINIYGDPNTSIVLSTVTDRLVSSEKLVSSQP